MSGQRWAIWGLSWDHVGSFGAKKQIPTEIFWCLVIFLGLFGANVGDKKGVYLKPLFVINKIVFAQQFLALSKPTPTVF